MRESACWPNAIGWSEKGPVGAAVHVVRADPHPARTTPTPRRWPRSPRAEQAKRRLIAELHELKLPIVGRDEDPEYGLAFDLLSSEYEKVFTGHDNGVITLDLAEGDDVHREQLRIAMDEPYRTLLGHFRHEIGHYYYYRLIDPSTGTTCSSSAELFGDPDADYQEALDRHYSEGAPAGWEKSYVSSYATMHPAEDWAETFAHYLHIRDTLDTSAAFGFAPAGATFERRVLGPSGFDTIIEMWLPLSWALNMVNRSMGKDDLYPFVLPAAGAGEDALHPHRHRRVDDESFPAAIASAAGKPGEAGRRYLGRQGSDVTAGETPVGVCLNQQGQRTGDQHADVAQQHAGEAPSRPAR